MIPGLINSFSGATPAIVLFNGSGVARCKVKNKHPTSNTQFGGVQIPMKIKSGKQVTIHSLQQPVYHVVGSMAAWQIVSF